MSFVDGGKCFVCNLCGLKNQCPDYYFSSVGLYGRRADVSQRAELCLGTVEFNAPAV